MSVSAVRQPRSWLHLGSHRDGLVVQLICGLLGACGDDGTGPEAPAGLEFAVVLNSVDISLTVFLADSPASRFTVGLAPDGTPVTLDARGAAAIVPLGTVPAAAIVDLTRRQVVRTVPLPANSGATGVAFVNDSIALVANPNLNSVTTINVRSGVRGTDIPVGVFPQHVVASEQGVFVLNSELGPDFRPARPGTVTLLDPRSLAARGTVPLSGFNPGGGAIGPDGRLYVLNSGSFGQRNGSLSVVDPRTLREVEHHPGFGEFPGSVALGTDGRVYVASFGYGIAVWNPARRTFDRSPQDPVTPGNIRSSSGLGFDSTARLYALKPDCRSPSAVFRLTAAFAVESEIQVGICPIDLAFTVVPGTR
ncbi:MAG: hypothetical protein HY704_12480 [Gemmatimonadetes bacterium]|nr:hypothetical protein [Gemmatimonadota bacterium]